jgi:catechol 2,3-dioxygenase-like lactoylglutathione lyase family enzyme
MAITHIQLLSLPVRDQDRARDFYVEVLGFELVREMPMGPDARWVQVRPPGAATSITLVTWFDSMPAGSSAGLVLEVDDLDATITELRSRGLDLPSEIAEEPWGRFVTCSDPDGNGLILQQTAI